MIGRALEWGWMNIGREDWEIYILYFLWNYEYLGFVHREELVLVYIYMNTSVNVDREDYCDIMDTPDRRRSWMCSRLRFCVM